MLVMQLFDIQFNIHYRLSRNFSLTNANLISSQTVFHCIAINRSRNCFYGWFTIWMQDEKDTEVKRDVPGKSRIVIKRKETGPITNMLENECKNNRGEKTVLSTTPRNWAKSAVSLKGCVPKSPSEVTKCAHCGVYRVKITLWFPRLFAGLFSRISKLHRRCWLRLSLK